MRTVTLGFGSIRVLVDRNMEKGKWVHSFRMLGGIGNNFDPKKHEQQCKAQAWALITDVRLRRSVFGSRALDRKRVWDWEVCLAI